MTKVSYPAIALVILFAMFFSIFGTFMALEKTGITGMVSHNTTIYASASLTVLEAIWINITKPGINLGNINVEESNNSDTVGDYWIMHNEGSINISIHAYDDQENGAGENQGERGIGPFTSDTASKANSCLDNWGAGIHNCFMIECNGTQSGNECNETYYPLWNATSTNYLVKDLSPDNEIDEVNFGINVTIPPGEKQGVKSQTVTFTAENCE